MCSPYQNLTDADFEKQQADRAKRRVAQRRLTHVGPKGRGFDIAVLDPNTVLSVVRKHVQPGSSVSMLVYSYQAPSDRYWNDQTAAVQIVQPDGSQRNAVAVFTLRGVFVRLDPLGTSDLEKSYTFARAVAAYALLNDLLANDSLIPRLGCARAFDVQLASMPVVLDEVKAAAMTPPAASPSKDRAALQAYLTFRHSPKSPTDALTKQTLEKLGDSPTMQFVYEDPDTTLHTGTEFDVVRISNGRYRTYAGMYVDKNGTATMSWPALCLVGDQRCARYYLWP